MSDYMAFLASKAPRPSSTGFTPQPMHDALFDYQQACAVFAIRQGRSGLFLDTGLGKTLIELEFAQQIAQRTNRPVLVLTPLAVARQIEREAARFGYDARVIRDQGEARSGINLCNYDRLDKLDPSGFGGVVLDESSILKAFTGATSRALRDSFAGCPYKLSATATPAPNDHMELGQQAEFLEVMRSVEMLSRFFINDTSQASQHWRIKGHAEAAFWDWMASWSRVAETPEDLGFDGSRFRLQALNILRHRVAGTMIKPFDGGLFAGEISATNLHDVKRQTAEARAEAVASLVAREPAEPWVLWCDTDYEADALLRAVPGASEVRGSHQIERKEETLEAFASGEVRCLVTKPRITGYGLNWQHCARMAFVGRSFSYELWYQAVRRCWRFGQQRAVDVHLAVAEGEEQIGRVIERKTADHLRMKRAMAAAMRRAVGSDAAARRPYEPKHQGRVPAWLSAA